MKRLLEKIYGQLDNLSSAEREKLLKELRKKVDKTDKRLIDLLKDRAAYSVAIGKLKRSLGIKLYSPERENEILKNIISLTSATFSKKTLEKIYERIIDESRALQKKEVDLSKLSSGGDTGGKIKWRDLLTPGQLGVVVGIFFAFISILYFTFFTPNHFEGKAPVTFDIKKGETFSQIVDSLYDRGIIPGKTNMKIAAFLYGAEKKIRAARFHIPNNLSYLDLLDLFINGKADFARKVKIKDGQTIKWLAFKLERDVFVDSTEFVNLASDTNFITSLGLHEQSLEGYLFPKEYEIYERSSPEEALKIFYKGFLDFMVDSLRQRAAELNMSIHEVLTLASIVKGETDLISEMPRIAGVYHNRLKRGMKLQADPTIQYLLPGGWRRLLYEDLKIDSPYNTYINIGLPPGPINNPGKDAVLAVLYPEENNYLYFVSNGKGGHKFAKTYNQHLRNVREYRRWLQRQKKQ